MFKALTILVALFANAAIAEPLADMDGPWNGSGWARETLGGPKEAVRCRLKNTYDAGALKVSGRCAVPGRKITLAGEMRGSTGAEKITGHWFNPDGLGSVRITGVQRGDVVAFTFRAKNPETGAEIAQNVEWRLETGRLVLRSTVRANPSATMSEIIFTR